MAEPTKPAVDALVAALLGEETWPKYGRMDPGLKDHMQALGVLIAEFNSLELSFFLIFWHYFNDTRTQAAQIIFGRLNNQHRLELTKHYVDSLEIAPAVKEKLSAFFKAYEICTENRNFLAHSQLHSPEASSDLKSLLSERQITLKKPPKNDPAKINYTQLSKTELRKISEDIQSTDRFGIDLFLFLRARQTGGLFNLGSETYTPSLPDTPQTPRKLILSDSIVQTNS